VGSCPAGIQQVVVDGRDADTVLLIQQEGPCTRTGDYYGVVLRSLDGGISWVPLSLRAGFGFYRSVPPIAAGPTSFWILADPPLASTDGGLFFRQVLSAPGVPNSIAFDPRDPRRVYAGVSGGLIVSDDGGDTWKLVAFSQEVSSVVVNAADPAEVFAKAGADWFRSADHGSTWVASSSGGTDLLAFDSANPALIFGHDGSEIQKTVDHGSQWRPIVGGLKATAISALASDKGRPGHVYAAANTSGFLTGAATKTDVYETNDAGETWIRLSSVAADYVTMLAFDHVSGFLYAGSDDGFFGSSDGGSSWRLLLPGPNRFVAVASPGVLYVGGLFLHRSNDAGSTWTVLMGVGSVSALAVDPKDPNVVYTSGLMKSTNGGASWVRLDPELSSSSLKVVVDPVDSRNVYVADYFGILRSPDGGLTWVAGRVHPFGGIVSLVAHPSISGELFALDGAAHVLRSLDYGETWRTLPDVPDLGCGGSFCSFSQIMSLALSSDGGTLYVATVGESVFVYRPVDVRQPRTVRPVPYR